MGHVSADMLRARLPATHEDYLDYLASFDLFGRGFASHELVVPGERRHGLPPRALWQRMPATFALAIELRDRMVHAGAQGLAVAAAYRPEGGARDSQHKHNAALDLDLLPSDGHLARDFVLIAAKLWREHEHLRCGAGTYAPAGAGRTHRVHIDTGHRFRCWQGTGAGQWASRPDLLVAAPPDDEVPGEGWHEIAGIQIAMEATRVADRDCARRGASWPS